MSYIFIASMDVDPGKEDLFNEVYDTEHIPFLLEVPGVRSATRYTAEALEVEIGGERKRIEPEGPRYSAIYEIDGPEVLLSPEWIAAVETGRWPTEVRPHTRNRRHEIRRRRQAGPGPAAPIQRPGRQVTRAGTIVAGCRQGWLRGR